MVLLPPYITRRCV